MIKLTKRMRIIRERIHSAQLYDINQALILIKELASARFIESVDVAVNLGIDARRSDQNIRGYVILPHGTGRFVRVAVFAHRDDAVAAKASGAELIGMEDLAEKIKKGELNFDVVIASPDAMHIVSQVGQILGPRGLMPNPKIGTVTPNIGEAVKNAKSGQVCYRNDKNGIIHLTIGKVSFSSEQLIDNLESFLFSIKKSRPPQVKGLFIKKISLSSTMGASLTINPVSLKSCIT
ncbi:50S ribosomal protein L1 [Candidatus Erwinia haradaeae]|uniref:Large ribosomal subunit protein uL1 n=1 Tax=Candidatus Erwinia haradaeae TaxID=1922217 RepID=A0A451DI27_9GAMM|nr:50S ribosomal protein L1 [Candidatus Erwinia haradaeae]VFP86320.1 50S ribosomal protein L1 [Candidatus Erwinia haradaeae]